VSVIVGGAFLRHQGLWGDEVTQLSGLTLGPVELLRWLSGLEGKRFGAPDDRIPPLSYFLGMLWGEVFGKEPGALRWLGVCCVAVGSVVVCRTAYFAFGLRSAVVAGLLFSLSPNVVYQSVEIRAYPLFIMLSAFATYFLIRLVRDVSGDARFALVGLGVSIVLASYTHFFRLVMGAGMLGAGLVLTWGRLRGPMLWCIGLTGVAVLGLIPFVLGALKVGSGVPGAAGGIGDVVRLAYRLCGHASMWVNMPLMGVGLVGFLVLLVLAVCAKRDGGRVHLFLTLALVIGFVIVGGARFVMTGLDTTRPPYSYWMLPGLSVLLGSAMALRGVLVRRICGCAAAVLLVSFCYGDYHLAKNGTYFAHTPIQEMRGVIDGLGVENVALVHELESETFRAPYWPTSHIYGERLQQFLMLQAGSDPAGHASATHISGPTRMTDPLALDFDFLMVVRAKTQGAGALAAQIREGDVALGDGYATKILLDSPAWRRVEERLFVSFVKCDVDVFERVPAGDVK
jgi:hypothetical protein